MATRKCKQTKCFMSLLLHVVKFQNEFSLDYYEDLKYGLTAKLFNDLKKENKEKQN